MFNKGIIKIISVLLLVAVIDLVIPFQNIFHHHIEQVCASHEGTSLNVHEKSCCKHADFFNHTSAILQEQKFTFFDTQYYFKSSGYVGHATSPVYFVANKAPPIA